MVSVGFVDVGRRRDAVLLGCWVRNISVAHNVHPGRLSCFSAPTQQAERGFEAMK